MVRVVWLMDCHFQIIHIPHTQYPCHLRSSYNVMIICPTYETHYSFVLKVIYLWENTRVSVILFHLINMLQKYNKSDLSLTTKILEVLYKQYKFGHLSLFQRHNRNLDFSYIYIFILCIDFKLLQTRLPRWLQTHSYQYGDSRHHFSNNDILTMFNACNCDISCVDQSLLLYVMLYIALLCYIRPLAPPLECLNNKCLFVTIINIAV